MNQTSPDPIRTAAIEAIRDTLAICDSERVSTSAVHAVRVCTKKLRAYLRAYPGKAPIRAANRKLKILADSFSDFREAHVVNQTLQLLVADWPMRKRKKYAAVLEYFSYQQRRLDNNDLSINARTGFEEVLRAWPNNGNSIDDLYRGLDRVYIKANRLGEVALKSNIDDAYHRWRRWVKYWLYCLTGIAQGKVPVAYKKKLSRLAESLGQFQDLCMLEKALMSPNLQHEFGDMLKPYYKALKAEKKAMKRSYKKAHKSIFKLGYKKRQHMAGVQIGKKQKALNQQLATGIS
ncbi:MAG: CHAD domain-containing protein [Pseudomonadales bacterium]|nr:CHAD domain-containing protein [Pseudomonadales bacterium]